MIPWKTKLIDPQISMEVKQGEQEATATTVCFYENLSFVLQ